MCVKVLVEAEGSFQCVKQTQQVYRIWKQFLVKYWTEISNEQLVQSPEIHDCVCVCVVCVF